MQKKGRLSPFFYIFLHTYLYCEFIVKLRVLITEIFRQNRKNFIIYVQYNKNILAKLYPKRI
jgi:hypothetical protein